MTNSDKITFQASAVNTGCKRGRRLKAVPLMLDGKALVAGDLKSGQAFEVDPHTGAVTLIEDQANE
jgi:hypothetical protein